MSHLQTPISYNSCGDCCKGELQLSKMAAPITMLKYFKNIKKYTIRKKILKQRIYFSIWLRGLWLLCFVLETMQTYVHQVGACLSSELVVWHTVWVCLKNKRSNTVITQQHTRFQPHRAHGCRCKIFFPLQWWIYAFSKQTVLFEPNGILYVRMHHCFGSVTTEYGAKVGSNLPNSFIVTMESSCKEFDSLTAAFPCRVNPMH